MSRRIALTFLAIASPVMVFGLLAPGLGLGRLGIWLFALGTAGFPVALSALGASRRGRLGGLAWSLLILLVLLVGSVAAVLVFSGGGPTWGGWPLALLAPLAGFWLLAFPLVIVSYARTFDVAGLPGGGNVGGDGARGPGAAGGMRGGDPVSGEG